MFKHLPEWSRQKQLCTKCSLSVKESLAPTNTLHGLVILQWYLGSMWLTRVKASSCQFVRRGSGQKEASWAWPQRGGRTETCHPAPDLVTLVFEEFHHFLLWLVEHGYFSYLQFKVPTGMVWGGLSFPWYVARQLRGNARRKPKNLKKRLPNVPSILPLDSLSLYYSLFLTILSDPRALSLCSYPEPWYHSLDIFNHSMNSLLSPLFFSLYFSFSFLSVSPLPRS